MGPYATEKFDPEGRAISNAEYEAKKGEWLISDADREYVKALMHPVYERGKMANWIAPPSKGINGMPVDFEYVKPPNA